MPAPPRCFWLTAGEPEEAATPKNLGLRAEGFCVRAAAAQRLDFLVGRAIVGFQTRPSRASLALRNTGSSAFADDDSSDSHLKQQRTYKHGFAISPRLSREVCLKFSPLRNQRAQGMPGARCTRSLACEIKKHTSVVTTVTPELPGIPRAMVLRLTSCSPR